MEDKKYTVLIMEDNREEEDNEETGEFLINNHGETNEDFKIKYVRTDGWRGYYTAEAINKDEWEEKDNGWVTGNWSDAGENSSDNVEQKLDKLQEKYDLFDDMAVIFLPTNNCFSTNYQVFIKK